MFYFRDSFSVQDKVSLHEAQLCDEDAKLHDGQTPFILLLNPEMICGMHIIITSCTSVSDLRWLKIPKLPWKTKSGKGFWQYQSF